MYQQTPGQRLAFRLLVATLLALILLIVVALLGPIASNFTRYSTTRNQPALQRQDTIEMIGQRTGGGVVIWLTHQVAMYCTNDQTLYAKAQAVKATGQDALITYRQPDATDPRTCHAKTSAPLYLLIDVQLASEATPDAHANSRYTYDPNSKP